MPISSPMPSRVSRVQSTEARPGRRRRAGHYSRTPRADLGRSPDRRSHRGRRFCGRVGDREHGLLLDSGVPAELEPADSRRLQRRGRLRLPLDRRREHLDSSRRGPGLREHPDGLSRQGVHRSRQQPGQQPRRNGLHGLGGRPIRWLPSGVRDERCRPRGHVLALHRRGSELVGASIPCHRMSDRSRSGGRKRRQPLRYVVRLQQRRPRAGAQIDRRGSYVLGRGCRGQRSRAMSQPAAGRELSDRRRDPVDRH